MKLRLSDEYVIDTDDYRREGLRIAILAMSGHGKSNAAADIVEDVLDQQGQAIVLEPITEWHTLKARYNNVVTVGGEYQDLPLEPDFAREYVHASLENGVNLIVNVSDLEEESEQRKFVADFLWNLYRSEQKYRRVVFLAVEEADTWAPQMWDQTSKQSLARVSLIAKHGRKIGIFPIFITQRPADFHKSPLSQCNVILFGKFTSSADLDPKTGVMYVVKKLHIPIQEKDIIGLETGEFIAWDKFGVHKVKVRKRLCPHGADTPLVAPVPFAAGVTETLGSLKVSIEKALEARRRERSETERLRADLEAKEKELQEWKKKAEIKIAVTELLQPSVQGPEPPDLKAKIEELTQTYEERISELEGQAKERTQRILQLEKEKAEINERLQDTEKKLECFGALGTAFVDLITFTVDLKLRSLPAQVHEEIGKQLGEMKLKLGPAAFDRDTAITFDKTVPDITVVDKRQVLTIDEATIPGQILAIAMEGLLEKGFRLGDFLKELRIRGYGTPRPSTVSRELESLVKLKALRREESRGQWVYYPAPGFEKYVKKREDESG